MVSSLSEVKDSDLVPGRKIASRTYRDVYAFDDKVVKILRPRFGQGRSLLSGNSSVRLRTLRRYGIWDFNRHEQGVYTQIERRLPEVVKDHIPRIIEVGNVGCKSASLVKRVMNEDGTPAVTLIEKGAEGCVLFWERLESLIGVFLQKDIYLMELTGSNIMIQERLDGSSLPMLTDIKRGKVSGGALSSWVLSEDRRKKQILERYQSLRQKYCC